MRCEAGAHYRRGRIVYRCPEEATHELVDAELVYLLWCDRHAGELAEAMTSTGRLRVERIETDPPNRV